LKTVIERISAWAIDDNSRKYETKAPVMLDLWLAKPQDKFRTVGWLELDNGYMFFSDKTMFERTCQLFDIEFPAKKKPPV
jgi:hypothetical protein